MIARYTLAERLLDTLKVRKSGATCAQLSASTGKAPQSVAARLRELEGKGLITASDDSPIIWRLK